MEVYFEVFTSDGSYFCEGNTRAKHLEKTLWAHPDATVIVRDKDTHEVVAEEQPLKKVCRAWRPKA